MSLIAVATFDLQEEGMSRRSRLKRAGSPSTRRMEATPRPVMTLPPRSGLVRTLFQRLARILALGAAGGLGGALLLLLPDLWALRRSRSSGLSGNPLWRVLAIAILLVLGPARIARAVPRRLREYLAGWEQRVVPLRLRTVSRRLTSRLERAIAAPLPGPLSRLDILSSWALGRPATVVTATVAVLFLLAWIPHYLTWPWWPDVDQFAVSAQSWSAGIVPYRDQVDFDFPGPIYLHFLLGKIFGWGATVAFHAMDAGFVVIFGVALVAWSRRRFGSALPGLVSYLTFLGLYLNFDYSLVAQRDWHAALLVILGLFALEVWPGKEGRLISALAVGLSFAFRPQELVFLPALLAAIDEGARVRGEPWWRSSRPWLEWTGLLVLATILAFSPLILAGVLDDLVRRVLNALDGPYNVRSDFSFQQGLPRLFPRSGDDARTRGRGRAGAGRSRGAAASGTNLGAGAARRAVLQADESVAPWLPRPTARIDPRDQPGARRCLAAADAPPGGLGAACERGPDPRVLCAGHAEVLHLRRQHPGARATVSAARIRSSHPPAAETSSAGSWGRANGIDGMTTAPCSPTSARRLRREHALPTSCGTSPTLP